ncbi:SMC-Scp complex subunit ScpB [Haloplasma contractile]|uniref:Segregation and condensation protein B n=1 Tax=Haloplasma contractile SSD-17B TaxID=1033810 RepID=F7PVM0_9MOLU|nr:SMC-Scp complex subunit ScpB [Haloplasma contractile]ERJ12814.1 Segregation protein [Haloplasma contractile SSD-17B]
MQELNKSRLLAALEAILYVSGDDGITIEQIQYVFDLNRQDAKELITTLQSMYNDNGRGITIINTAESFRMATSREYFDYFKKFLTDPKKTRLSNATMEVLSIVAYKQPVTRAEIEDIRGTNSDNIVRRLLAMSLIKEVGRLETPGRPIIYGTTSDFLDYFGLNSLEELPELLGDFNDGVPDETDLFSTHGMNNEEIEKNE